MPKQYRLVRFSKEGVLAEPLDGIGVEYLKVRARRRYVENEILIVADSLASDLCVVVLGTRIDPGYSADRFLGVRRNAAGAHELEPSLDFDDLTETLDGIYHGRQAPTAKGAAACRKLLRCDPLIIEAAVYLGVYEWERGRTGRAAKYFESAWRAGRRAVPSRFRGHLCHRSVTNRAFLYAANGCARTLLNGGHDHAAENVLEGALALDPCDPLNLRELVALLKIRAGSTELAREALAAGPLEGLGHYFHYLLELAGGRTPEAVRSLCRGMAYNPDVLLAVFREPSGRVRRHPHRCRRKPPKEEAADHARELGFLWRAGGGLRLIRKLTLIKPFLIAIQRPEILSENVIERIVSEYGR